MDVINDIMFTCCIFHNMILEDEQDVHGLEDIVAKLQSEDPTLQWGFTFEDLLTST